MRLRLLLFLIYLPFFTHAQVIWENQVWSSISAEKKLFSKVKAELTLEARWNTDPLMAVRYFPNIAIQQKWSDHFTTAFHYRYITNNRGLGFTESSHRLMLDAIVNGAVGKTDLSFRLRAGREDEPNINEGILTLSEFVLRQKFSIRHKILKQDITVSFEQFETIRGNDIQFTQQRYLLGNKVKLSKQHFLDFFLMYQNLIAVKRINLGIGYTYKFND